jgi:hypothetical protein
MNSPPIFLETDSSLTILETAKSKSKEIIPQKSNLNTKAKIIPKAAVKFLPVKSEKKTSVEKEVHIYINLYVSIYKYIYMDL